MRTSGRSRSRKKDKGKVNELAEYYGKDSPYKSPGAPLFEYGAEKMLPPSSTPHLFPAPPPQGTRGGGDGGGGGGGGGGGRGGAAGGAADHSSAHSARHQRPQSARILRPAAMGSSESPAVGASLEMQRRHMLARLEISEARTARLMEALEREKRNARPVEVGGAGVLAAMDPLALAVLPGIKVGGSAQGAPGMVTPATETIHQMEREAEAMRRELAKWRSYASQSRVDEVSDELRAYKIEVERLRRRLRAQQQGGSGIDPISMAGFHMQQEMAAQYAVLVKEVQDLRKENTRLSDAVMRYAADNDKLSLKLLDVETAENQTEDIENLRQALRSEHELVVILNEADARLRTEAMHHLQDRMSVRNKKGGGGIGGGGGGDDDDDDGVVDIDEDDGSYSGSDSSSSSRGRKKKVSGQRPPPPESAEGGRKGVGELIKERDYHMRRADELGEALASMGENLDAERARGRDLSRDLAKMATLLQSKDDQIANLKILLERAQQQQQPQQQQEEPKRPQKQEQEQKQLNSSLPSSARPHHQEPLNPQPPPSAPPSRPDQRPQRPPSSTVSTVSTPPPQASDAAHSRRDDDDDHEPARPVTSKFNQAGLLKDDDYDDDALDTEEEEEEMLQDIDPLASPAKPSVKAEPTAGFAKSEPAAGGGPKAQPAQDPKPAVKAKPQDVVPGEAVAVTVHGAAPIVYQDLSKDKRAQLDKQLWDKEVQHHAEEAARVKASASTVPPGAARYGDAVQPQQQQGPFPDRPLPKPQPTKAASLLLQEPHDEEPEEHSKPWNSTTTASKVAPGTVLRPNDVAAPKVIDEFHSIPPSKPYLPSPAPHEEWITATVKDVSSLSAPATSGKGAISSDSTAVAKVTQPTIHDRNQKVKN
jgi:colicin import membrane protein